MIRFLLGATIARSASTTLAAEPAKQPNVVVILADDQGWDDLSLNGNPNLRTRHIDSLAKDGARFERFFVQPVCSPTRSENVWQLTAAKVLSVLEEGGTLDELAEFLKAHTTAPLPHTVEVFLQDQRERAGRLRDLGMARLLECADAALAQMLASDPQLRGKCHVAGERWLVFRMEEEAAVRRGLRRLGHIVPPPHG